MKCFISIFIFSFTISAGCQTKPKVNTNQKMSEEQKPAKSNAEHANNPYYSRTDTSKLNVSNEEWKKILPADVYAVARLAGTERAFTGKYWDFSGLGKYYCVVCGNALFRADQKFSSSCGWPSFFEPLRKDAVEYKRDLTHGMDRMEVLCARCNSHLGHVFEDGPPPTGLRFCMNSIALEFEPENALNPKKP